MRQALTYYNRYGHGAAASADDIEDDSDEDDSGAIFFTKNGRYIGIAFRGISTKVCWVLPRAPRVQGTRLSQFPRVSHGRVIYSSFRVPSFLPEFVMPPSGSQVVDTYIYIFPRVSIRDVVG